LVEKLAFCRAGICRSKAGQGLRYSALSSCTVCVRKGAILSELAATH
jgi:hypothetical protein